MHGQLDAAPTGGAAALTGEPPLSTRHGAAMRLSAVRERGCIVDFRWDYANAMAARLMHTLPLQLIGKRLRDVVGPLGHPALIDRYRRVVEQGQAQTFEQVHLVGGEQSLVRHCIVRSGDGVLVSLINLSAQQRRPVPPLLAPSRASRPAASRQPHLPGVTDEFILPQP